MANAWKLWWWWILGRLRSQRTVLNLGPCTERCWSCKGRGHKGYSPERRPGQVGLPWLIRRCATWSCGSLRGRCEAASGRSRIAEASARGWRPGRSRDSWRCWGWGARTTRWLNLLEEWKLDWVKKLVLGILLLNRKNNYCKNGQS